MLLKRGISSPPNPNLKSRRACYWSSSWLDCSSPCISCIQWQCSKRFLYLLICLRCFGPLLHILLICISLLRLVPSSHHHPTEIHRAGSPQYHFQCWYEGHWNMSWRKLSSRITGGRVAYVSHPFLIAVCGAYRTVYTAGVMTVLWFIFAASFLCTQSIVIGDLGVASMWVLGDNTVYVNGQGKSETRLWVRTWAVGQWHEWILCSISKDFQTLEE